MVNYAHHVRTYVSESVVCGSAIRCVRGYSSVDRTFFVLAALDETGIDSKAVRSAHLVYVVVYSALFRSSATLTYLFRFFSQRTTAAIVALSWVGDTMWAIKRPRIEAGGGARGRQGD